MVRDRNKHLRIEYNYLNLPKRIYSEFPGTDTIEYIYDAFGTKCQRIQKTASLTEKKTYCNSFIYSGAATSMELERIRHPEGSIKISGSSHSYQYFLKDHLGNTRVAFDDEGEILQMNDYYPFGMEFTGRLGGDIKYPYNGKEMQDEVIGGVGLDWYDYGARFYDPVIGRWHVQDPLAEYHFNQSPYTYVLNNPISFIDPFGLDTIYIAPDISKEE